MLSQKKVFFIRSTTAVVTKKKHCLLLISLKEFSEMISRPNGLNSFKVDYYVFQKEL